MEIDIDKIKKLSKTFCDSDEEFEQFNQYIDKFIDSPASVEYIVTESLYANYLEFLSLIFLMEQ